MVDWMITEESAGDYIVQRPDGSSQTTCHGADDVIEHLSNLFGRDEVGETDAIQLPDGTVKDLDDTIDYFDSIAVDEEAQGG